MSNYFLFKYYLKFQYADLLLKKQLVEIFIFFDEWKIKRKHLSESFGETEFFFNSSLKYTYLFTYFVYNV